jgi:hypothetical protein
MVSEYSGELNLNDTSSFEGFLKVSLLLVCRFCPGGMENSDGSGIVDARTWYRLLYVGLLFLFVYGRDLRLRKTGWKDLIFRDRNRHRLE